MELIAVAVICLLVAAYQSRRADRLVVLLLERDKEQRDSRAELVQAFLDEQRRQEQRHEAERLQWRDERGELLNAALLAASNQPAMMAPAWPPGEPAKLYATEADEVAEARAKVAARIEEELNHRIPLGPDMGDAA